MCHTVRQKTVSCCCGASFLKRAALVCHTISHFYTFHLSHMELSFSEHFFFLRSPLIRFPVRNPLSDLNGTSWQAHHLFGLHSGDTTRHGRCVTSHVSAKCRLTWRDSADFALKTDPKLSLDFYGRFDGAGFRVNESQRCSLLRKNKKKHAGDISRVQCLEI